MASFELAKNNTLDFEQRVLEKVAGDPGGETDWGIDRENNPNWVGWQVLDNMQNTSKTAQEACAELMADIDAYYRAIWDGIRGDEIKDQHLANYFFDMVVNPGILSKKAIQMLLGFSDGEVDGKIGDFTIAAINSTEPENLIAKLKAWRIDYYNSRGAWADKFKQGWLNRANEIK